MPQKLALIWLLRIYLSSSTFSFVDVKLDKSFVSCFKFCFKFWKTSSPLKKSCQPSREQALLLEDFVSSDTTFSIGKIMLAQQRASFDVGRLRLLWHHLFDWKDYASSATSKLCCWKTSSSLTQLSSGRLLAGPAPSKPYFRETSSPLIPLFDYYTLERKMLYYLE